MKLPSLQAPRLTKIPKVYPDFKRYENRLIKWFTLHGYSEDDVCRGLDHIFCGMELAYIDCIQRLNQAEKAATQAKSTVYRPESLKGVMRYLDKTARKALTLTQTSSTRTKDPRHIVERISKKMRRFSHFGVAYALAKLQRVLSDVDCIKVAQARVKRFGTDICTHRSALCLYPESYLREKAMSPSADYVYQGIRKCKEDFVRENNKEPNVVYLGAEMSLAFKHGLDPSLKTNRYGDELIEDMKVIYVIKKHHISVGRIEDPMCFEYSAFKSPFDEEIRRRERRHWRASMRLYTYVYQANRHSVDHILLLHNHVEKTRVTFNEARRLFTMVGRVAQENARLRRLLQDCGGAAKRSQKQR